MPHKDPAARKVYAAAYQKRWRAANPERARELGRQSFWRRRESVRARESERKKQTRLRKYGLTNTEFLNLLESQNCACPGCSAELSAETARVDHDHTTAKVRGLLCNHCNLALGHATDSPETLRRLALYLEK